MPPAPARRARPIPLAVLTGAIASGKIRVALELAERWAAEIVSVDSTHVYRHLDSGAAKPTAAQRVRFPHHPLDPGDPDEPFDAVRFREAPDAAIPDIAARARLAGETSSSCSPPPAAATTRRPPATPAMPTPTGSAPMPMPMPTPVPAPTLPRPANGPRRWSSRKSMAAPGRGRAWSMRHTTRW